MQKTHQRSPSLCDQSQSGEVVRLVIALEVVDYGLGFQAAITWCRVGEASKCFSCGLGLAVFGLGFLGSFSLWIGHMYVLVYGLCNLFR